MKTLKVAEMSCNHCVERIHRTLDAVGIAHSVSLEAKSVTIEDDSKTGTAIEELADIGFTAE